MDISQNSCVWPRVAERGSNRKEGGGVLGHPSPDTGPQAPGSLQGWSKLRIRARSHCEPSKSPFVTGWPDWAQLVVGIPCHVMSGAWRGICLRAQ